MAYFRSSRTIASKSTVLLPVTCHRPGDAGLYFQQSAAMPRLVSRQFIRNRRPRANQRHLTTKNIDELRQFVQAGLAKKPPERGNPLVTSELINTRWLFDSGCAPLLISFVTNSR